MGDVAALRSTERRDTCAASNRGAKWHDMPTGRQELDEKSVSTKRFNGTGQDGTFFHRLKSPRDVITQ